MNNDVIERLAAAAFEMGPPDEVKDSLAKRGIGTPPWGDLDEEDRTAGIAFTRNLLTVLREPSAAMIEAGGEAMYDADNSGVDDKPDAREVLPPAYRAMIDSLLSDQPHSPEQQR